MLLGPPVYLWVFAPCGRSMTRPAVVGSMSVVPSKPPLENGL